MGEADVLPGDLDHTCADGVAEILNLEVLKRGAKRAKRRVSERRDREQRRLRAGAHPLQPMRDRLGERGRDAQSAPILGASARELELAAECQDVQGVTTRDLLDPLQHPPRDLRLKHRRKQPLRCPQVNALQLDDLDPSHKPFVRLRPQRPVTAGSPRQQQADPLLANAPQRKRQHPGRGAVQPLLIVDRDHNRRFSREISQHAEKSARQRIQTLRRLGQVAEKQRRAQRPPLRIRQALQRLSRETVKQIAESRERKRRVRLTRRRHQHPITLAPCTLHRIEPDGRLPDPGGSLDRDPDRPSRRKRQQLPDSCPFCFASEQVAQAPYKSAVFPIYTTRGQP